MLKIEDAGVDLGFHLLQRPPLILQFQAHFIVIAEAIEFLSEAAEIDLSLARGQLQILTEVGGVLARSIPEMDVTETISQHIQVLAHLISDDLLMTAVKDGYDIVGLDTV